MRKLAVCALAALAAGPALAQAAPPRVEPAHLSETVQVLASDAFQGRAPGTPGEAKTVDYLVHRLQALGAPLDLLVAFFARHVEHPLVGQRQRDLQHQR